MVDLKDKFEVRAIDKVTSPHPCRCRSPGRDLKFLPVLQIVVQAGVHCCHLITPLLNLSKLIH